MPDAPKLDPTQPAPAAPPAAPGDAAPDLPYKLACLCDLRDAQGRVLLLHRLRAPNKDLCSPIGGKLEMGIGESPAQCAQREIAEEAGIHVDLDRLHLMGLISEQSFEGSGHWLLFYYRVMGPVEVTRTEMDEGRLEWHEPAAIDALQIPETDRRIIWPMVRAHEPTDEAPDPGFFAVHIDCRQPEMAFSVNQSIPPAASGRARGV